MREAEGAFKQSEKEVMDMPWYSERPSKLEHRLAFNTEVEKAIKVLESLIEE